MCLPASPNINIPSGSELILVTRHFPLSTCRLIPLLTVGQPFNWFPPPPNGDRGSTLMKLHLGAPVLASYTPGVMISSAARVSASGCFNLLPAAYSCWPGPVNSEHRSRYEGDTYYIHKRSHKHRRVKVRIPTQLCTMQTSKIALKCLLLCRNKYLSDQIKKKGIILK